MEEIIIRPASLDDLGTLLHFEQGVITAERPFDPTLKKGDTHYYDIAQMITAPHIELVVAQSGSEIIGCGYARIENAKPYLDHQQKSYLGFMYVDPGHRGQGVNKLIIAALKQWTLSQNITEMRLDVYYDNTAAVKAYEKAGFKKHMIEMRMGPGDN
ncbi:MAG: GNAT family N-acetyltransferase [Ferruginibacter sp.]|nr:GNAT family N-acetyltransferase [Chitinophagaceae bacterium]